MVPSPAGTSSKVTSSDLSGIAASGIQRNANLRGGSASITVNGVTCARGVVSSPQTSSPTPPVTASKSESAPHHSRMCSGLLTTS